MATVPVLRCHTFASVTVLIAALGVLQTSAAASLPLTDCRLENAIGAANAKCGWYEVAEDRDHPEGVRIKIHVAVVPALRRQPLPDPIFVLSGGPGQAASDFYLGASGSFETLRRNRDIVVIDQRGTGRSNRLDCVLPDELESESFDAALVSRYTEKCLAKLPGDPRFYTTSVAVRDLEDIRRALGYAQVNLYGISYGTRVAQHYLRRYPDLVRTVTLDGIVPTDAILGPEVAPAAQQAVNAILARCQQAPDCAATFPHVAQTLADLLKKLSLRTSMVTLADPRTGVQRTMEFSNVQLAVALRLHSYSDISAALLPYLITEAAAGRAEAMAAQALLVARDLGDQMANGMHNAVVCTEDVPFFTPEALADPAISASFMGEAFVKTLQSMCAVWPRGILDADFHQPLQSNKPALLLSGENDPVTPVRFGEHAKQGYANGLHIVVPQQGHGQVTSTCLAKVFTQFVVDGSVSHLDTACVAKQFATPFMLNASGPSP